MRPGAGGGRRERLSQSHDGRAAGAGRPVAATTTDAATAVAPDPAPPPPPSSTPAPGPAPPAQVVVLGANPAWAAVVDAAAAQLPTAADEDASAAIASLVAARDAVRTLPADWRAAAGTPLPPRAALAHLMAWHRAGGGLPPSGCDLRDARPYDYVRLTDLVLATSAQPDPAVDAVIHLAHRLIVEGGNDPEIVIGLQLVDDVLDWLGPRPPPLSLRALDLGDAALDRAIAVAAVCADAAAARVGADDAPQVEMLRAANPDGPADDAELVAAERVAVRTWYASAFAAGQGRSRAQRRADAERRVDRVADDPRHPLVTMLAPPLRSIARATPILDRLDRALAARVGRPARAREIAMSLEVVALGVGDAFSAEHYSSCLAVGCDGAWLLIDCPHPIRKILRESGAGLDVGSFEACVVTHLHADHASGLEGYGYFSFFALRRPARLLMHPTVSARLWDGHLAAGMEELMSKSGELGSAALDDYFTLDALDDDLAVHVGPFSIECRRTIHHIPTTALRIRAGDRCFAYSADTAFDPTLIEWLSAGDLIIHETNLGVHTPYEKLAELPEELRARMRLIHYPDEFPRKTARSGWSARATASSCSRARGAA